MTVNLALPPSLQKFVRDQAAAAGHASADEYIVALLRERQRERAEQELEHLLLEATDALDRGECVEVTPEFWEKLRRKTRYRGKRKNAS